jgi:hypothetical protein
MSTGREVGALARVRRAAAELTPEAVELIALRVVQLLRHEGTTQADAAGIAPELVSADQLAKRLGLTRAWVYGHASELGAITLGDGPRPRLRFDPAIAAQALQARRRHTSLVGSRQAPVGSGVGRPRRRKAPVPLLPVHEPGSRRIRSLSRVAFYRRNR